MNLGVFDFFIQKRSTKWRLLSVYILMGGIMTEKRFSVKKSGSGLFYRDGDYEIDNTIQFIIETVEMKLNQLSDENEELKKENEFLKKRCNEYWEEAGLNNDYFE